MKKIPFSAVSTLKMVSGNEKKYSKVIHDGVLKEWVGIGWIELRTATKVDKLRYPTVSETAKGKK